MAGSGKAHLRSPDEALLRVEDLVVEFPVGRHMKVHAVSDISLDVLEGETLGLVGESGCGKSTTGRAIMQLPRPTSGKVEFGGRDLTQLPGEKLRQVRPELQLIFQDPISSLNPRRKVGDIVREPLEIWNRGDAKKRDAVVDEVLEAVGLDPSVSRGRRPHEFSGGQCQRICIARALVLDPKVIICDEPVSALDVSVQAQILNLLEDMKHRYGLTLIFIAHDLAVVKNVSDRVIVMYLGKLCEVSPPDALYAEPAHPYTAALLSAIPIPDPEASTRADAAAAGELPSPLAPPSGCRFRTRCPRAEERCAEEEPQMRPIVGAKDHFVACHFPLIDAEDAPLGPSTAEVAIRGGEVVLRRGPMGGAAVEAHERTRTRLDPQLRRSQIVEAAVRVFSETDPVEVTFEEIAEAAGVSRALVYNYFGDRGGLVAAVYLHTFHELNDHLNTAIDPDAPPEERLRTIVRGYLRFAVEHAAAWRLLQMTGALNHPAVQSARQRHMERLAHAWGAEGPEGRTLAYGVVGMLESATFDWVRDRDTDIDRLCDLIFDFLWTGLSSLDRHGIALPRHWTPESVPS